MAAPSFIPGLASLLILLPWAAPSDLALPAPHLSLDPPKQRFLIGDAVTALCSAPPPSSSSSREFPRGFRFSSSWGWVTDVRSSRRSFRLSLNLTDPRQGGALTCSYSALRPGRGEARSADSAAVIVNVQDRPARPNLTVTPAPLTVEGQPLLFSCLAPPGAAAPRRFRILRDDLEVSDGVLEASGSSGVLLKVEKVRRSQSGNFSCRYEEMSEGRWIASYASDAVEVEVTAASPAPVLRLRPPSGVVPAGHALLLRCHAPRRRFRRRFRFFRDGRQVTPDPDDVTDPRDVTDPDDDVTDPDDDVTEGSRLHFRAVSPNFAGNFSCRLEEEVGGAWLEAPPSRGVAVVVTAPNQPGLLPLVVGVAVGVASLLLALLLAAWICRKRRGGSRWRGLSPGDDTGTFRMGELEGAAA